MKNKKTEKSEQKKSNKDESVDKEDKLDLDELFRKANVPLHIFVGILVHAGKQSVYDEQVKKRKKKEKLDKMMSLDEFEELKEEYLNQTV